MRRPSRKNTVAAEAGEPCGCGYDNPDDVCILHEPIIKRHVAATIERCAQRLEELGVRYCQGHDLPAAIRVMKDSAMTNDEFVAALDRAKRATIERCAQVARDHLKLLYPDENVDKEAESIAATIRALKDQP